MPIVVFCPACRIRLTLGDDRAGDLLVCPNCEGRVRVPASEGRTPCEHPPPLPSSGRAAPKPPPLPAQPEPLSLEDDLAEGGEQKGFPSRRAAFVAGGILVLIGIGLVGREIRRASRPEEASSAGTSQPLTGEQVYRRLIRSTVLVVSSAGAGSGFVADARRRLVVTNYHVVLDESRAAVVFPLYNDRGELVTDASEYKEGRIRDVACRGKVLDRDPACDLAVVQVERLPNQAAAVTLARQPAAPGSVVYSIGGSGADDNLLWRFTRGSVRGRVRRRQAADFGRVDAMILETDALVNPGDSGGAVVNDRGELVGVVSHFLTRQRQVSGNIDAEEVRTFLARQGQP